MIKSMIKEPVDILVVTYNRIKYFKSFVKLLKLSTNYPYRLIVVDNGSADGTREWILEKEKEGIVWKHVFNSSNLPLARAFSEGFKEVESELFLTTADDITPPLFKKYDWLEVFVTKMKQDESVGCINFVGARCSYDSFQRRTGLI